MAEPTTPTPPPRPEVPQWIVTLLTALAGITGSPWFHSLLTAALAAFGTVWVAKGAVIDMIPDKLFPNLPRILPRPKKAEDAIGKIQFGNAGCTATIIGPVMSNDAKLDILTAAHCVKLGATGKMTLKDGRTLNVKCVARDPEADAAWLIADKPEGTIPYLELAERDPDAGEVVWHQGYGRDKPGNRETGIFKGSRMKGLQSVFRLSVSPGDSGGGIILDSASKVVSPVCCTTKLAGVGDVFGSSPQAAQKIRPKRTAADEDEPPLLYPVLPLPDGVEWEVLDMPLPAPPVLSKKK